MGLLYPHVGNDLVKVVTVNFGNLLVAVAFILGIEYEIVLVEVGVSPSRSVLKQADSTSLRLIAWMLETGLLQKRVKIFLPQPGAIEEDTVDFLVIMA